MNCLFVFIKLPEDISYFCFKIEKLNVEKLYLLIAAEFHNIHFEEERCSFYVQYKINETMLFLYSI